MPPLWRFRAVWEYFCNRHVSISHIFYFQFSLCSFFLFFFRQLIDLLQLSLPPSPAIVDSLSQYPASRRFYHVSSAPFSIWEKGHSAATQWRWGRKWWHNGHTADFLRQSWLCCREAAGGVRGHLLIRRLRLYVASLGESWMARECVCVSLLMATLDNNLIVWLCGWLQVHFLFLSWSWWL